MDFRGYQTVKALRVGIVVGGRVRADQIFRPGSEITIGNAPDCAFRIYAPFGSHTLFTLPFNEDCSLTILPGMTCRTREGTGEVVESAVSVSDREKALKLASNSRGKVTVGDVVFLFQFVDQPVLSSQSFEPEQRRGLWNRITDAVFNLLDQIVDAVSGLK